MQNIWIKFLCPVAFLASMWIPKLAAEEVESTLPLKDPSSAGWNAHAQATSVTQYHPQFNSPYSGPNSLSQDAEYKTSYTATAFFGFRLWSGGEIYINPEGQAGSGFSKTTGIAGFPNGEIYRVDTPQPKASWARVYVKQVFGFGGAKEKIQDDLNQIEGQVDGSRLTVIAGKFALNDFFDNNKYTHDPRTQFLNWALMDAGAWDYAANTKGYTTGALIEWHQKYWALRYAAVEEPKSANSIFLDQTRFPKTVRGDNLEAEFGYSLFDHPGKLRLLGFINHAHMGSYHDALATAKGTPDVTDSRSNRLKRGGVINIEQDINEDFGVFLKAGSNDGRNETWAFTEIDRSLTFGTSGKGSSWGRDDDTLGFALMKNDLSQDHRDFIKAGGNGFIVGDGRLNYQSEKTLEAFYSIGLCKLLHVSPDFQYIQNPAYNYDRGPVKVYSVRAHFQI
ncbi:MAG: carbohydrate porin [Chitinophagaceae bacterium]|nr:carbohydrate porin [Oligoflexus sp.]